MGICCPVVLSKLLFAVTSHAPFISFLNIHRMTFLLSRFMEPLLVAPVSPPYQVVRFELQDCCMIVLNTEDLALEPYHNNQHRKSCETSLSKTIGCHLVGVVHTMLMPVLGQLIP